MLTCAAHLQEAAAIQRFMGLSPGTVAIDMQVTIRAGGINPVRRSDRAGHLPTDRPARSLLQICVPVAVGRQG